MNAPDELSRYYADLLEGTYDCVDRTVLNAYFGPGLVREVNLIGRVQPPFPRTCSRKPA